MFDGDFNLRLLAEQFKENGIEWYVIGSISETVRGVRIQPSDMNIIVASLYKPAALEIG